MKKKRFPPPWIYVYSGEESGRQRIRRDNEEQLMYPSITMSCSDGTDPRCEGEMHHYLDYIGLTFDQIEEIEFQEGQAMIKLSPEQVRMNNLTEDHADYSNAEKHTWIEFCLDTTCKFCGSEQ